MVKYFFLKGYESRLIHKELVGTLLTVQNWLKRFKSGDLSCGDEERPGRPLISLGSALQRFRKQFSFASSRVMAGHFSVDPATAKNILDRELGLRKATHRCLSQILSAEQQLRSMKESLRLLTTLANLAEKSFQRISTAS
jgi:transposase